MKTLLLIPVVSCVVSAQNLIGPTTITHGSMTNPTLRPENGKPLEIVGSAAGNGNLVMKPGNVPGNGSVYINTPRSDEPGLVIQNGPATTTFDVFQIRDNTGLNTTPHVVFKIIGDTDAGCPSCVVASGIYSRTSNTYDLGSNTNLWRKVWAAEVDATTGFYSPNTASNTLNIPEGGVLAVNGTFGTASNYLIIQGTQPQLDGGSLGAAFQINGPNTVNGDIVLNPGNVSTNASVVINERVISEPALIINNIAGSSAGNIFEIRDPSNTAVFKVIRTADPGANAPNSVVSWHHYPAANNTYIIGAPANRWATIYAVNTDTSQTVTAGTGFYSGNSASNTLNIPNGGVLAFNGTFGSATNYLIIQGVQPQLDGGSLGAAFQINGSNSVNGNITLNPGNVAPNSSVVVNQRIPTNPALIVNNISGTGAGSIFEIRDPSNIAVFKVIRNNDPGLNAMNSIVSWHHYPVTANTYNIGDGGNRWATVFANNGNFSGQLSVGSNLSSYNGSVTAGRGMAAIYGSYAFTNLTTGISDTAFQYNGAPLSAGLYRVAYDLNCRTLGASPSGVIGVTIHNAFNSSYFALQNSNANFNCASGEAASNKSAIQTNVTFYTDGSAESFSGSGRAGFGVSVLSGLSNANYDFHLILEKLQ